MTTYLRAVCICSLSTFPCLYIFMHGFYHFFKIILYISVYFSKLYQNYSSSWETLFASVFGFFGLNARTLLDFGISTWRQSKWRKKRHFVNQLIPFQFQLFLLSHMQLCIQASTFTTLLLFIRSLNVFFVNQKKCFLKNDFGSQAKALEALKTVEFAKKFEGPILSGQYRTLFGAWVWN